MTRKARKEGPVRGGQSGRQIPVDHKAQREAERFNALYPLGTQVKYWTGVLEGEGKLGFTKSSAGVLNGHTAVVMIAGCVGCVALSHVRPAGPGDFVAESEDEE